MGQGPSSVDFNYVYSNSDNLTKKTDQTNQNKLNGFANQQDSSDYKNLDSYFKELLFTLKYHTNMISIDKNFVLKNKSINDKLDKKIDELKKQIINLINKNSTVNEKHNQLITEFTKTQTTYVVLKYTNIFLFIIFVAMLSFLVLKRHKL